MNKHRKPLINYTWPGRFHLIVGGDEVDLYVTLWLFSFILGIYPGIRLHYCKARKGIQEVSHETS